MGFGSRSSGTQRSGSRLLSCFWQGLRGGVERGWGRRRSRKEGTGYFPPGSQKTYEVFTKAQLGVVGHSQSWEEWGDICCPNLLFGM